MRALSAIIAFIAILLPSECWRLLPTYRERISHVQNPIHRDLSRDKHCLFAGKSNAGCNGQAARTALLTNSFPEIWRKMARNKYLAPLTVKAVKSSLWSLVSVIPIRNMFIKVRSLFRTCRVWISAVKYFTKWVCQ